MFFLFKKKTEKHQKQTQNEVYECNANANPKEKQFWSQEIERINTMTMSDKLTKAKSFAPRLSQMQTWSWDFYLNWP